MIFRVPGTCHQRYEFLSLAVSVNIGGLVECLAHK